jgi:hypothetical protein
MNRKSQVINPKKCSMKKPTFFIAMLLLLSSAMFAQVGINSDNSIPNSSAMLDVKSELKGLLIPRMTSGQIRLIPAPDNGLQVYCTDDGKLYIYVSGSSQWKEVAYGPGTLTPSTCGQTITKNHVEGVVAPVTKAVTYGIVLGIPGEPAKCWITSNLGADHPATAVDDTTDAPAGWYWQFNRKQGYKHDGTTRVPNTTWITSIVENSEWIAANDPCAIELGTGWRIPTVTEWTNVNASGGWTNWDGPFGSALKLHAAGTLLNTDGSLGYRGYEGALWSSSPSGTANGWVMAFYSWSSSIGYTKRAYAMPVRCLRDS